MKEHKGKQGKRGAQNMDCKKRSVLYLLRKRNRSVILWLILFVITTLMLACITIGHGAGAAMERLFQAMGGYFKIEADHKPGSNKYVNDELVNHIMDSYEIQEFNGMDTVYFMAGDMELAPGRFTQEGDEKAKLARLMGNTDTSLNEYFILQSLLLAKGRHITAEDSYKALLSQELAEKNGLSAGDTISLSYYGGDAGLDWHTFEIAGIFQIKSRQNSYTSNTAECDMVENFIFTDTRSIREMVGRALEREIDSYRSGALFFVDHPQTLERIVSDLAAQSEQGKEGWQVVKNNKQYQESRIPLERLKSLTTLIVAIVIVLGFLIVTLILLLWMRERVHETGIYLSMGISKISILMQHMMENLILAFLAFVLSCILAAGTMPRLEQAVLAVMDDESWSQTNESGSLTEQDIAQPESESDIEVTMELSFLTILQIGLLEFCVVILATGISLISILKMKPKSILSTMS